MAKTLALAAALLFHPLPVTSAWVVTNSGGSVTVNWTLPADPSVVGITITRDRLGSSETVVFVLSGLVTSFTDASLDPDESYRYWIHTRDAQGDLGDGVFVEVFGFDPDGHWKGWCGVTSVSGATAPWAVLAAALLLALASLRCGR